MIPVPNTLRPGVFASGHVYGAFGVTDLHGVAVVAPGTQSSPAGVKQIATPEDAAAYGNDTAIYRILETLLTAGVRPIYAVGYLESGEQEALKLTEDLESVSVLVYSGDASIVPAHLEHCAANGKERFAVLYANKNEAGETAKLLNSRHVSIVCDGGSHTECTASAFATCIAAQGATGGYNGLTVPVALKDFDGTLSTQEIESLLADGVTPFIKVGTQVECVRGVTCCTHVNHQPDRTFSDLCAALATDEVLRGVRTAVKSRLRGQKNSAITRESIASQILVVLESKRMQGVIDSYRPPLVRPHPSDPAVCVAELRLNIAPELAQIVLSAEILV